MKSQAYFLKKYGAAGSAFELRECQLPEPGLDEVLIEVESFGLNYADVMARNNQYKEAPVLPCILGYEVVGKVMTVGDSDKTNLIGKRVVSFTRFGGYSKHVITKVSALVEIEDLKDYNALALATQYVTAFYMSNYISPVRKDEKVLIHAAAGGVGTALIQLCKLNGAQVFAKVRNDEKKQYVLALGADEAINYLVTDYEEELKEKLNFPKSYIDVSFNPVAGKTFKKDNRLIGSGGRIILFGGSEISGGKWGILSSLNFVWKMGFIIPIGLMMRSKSVIGVNMLKIGDNKPEILAFCLAELMKLVKEGKLNFPENKLKEPLIFKATQIAEAHELLESGNSIGKITLRW